MDKKENKRRDREEKKDDLLEKLISMNRVSKSNKGGRKIAFSATVIVGDKRGKVGLGHGKANDVSDAIRKATSIARRSMKKVNVKKISSTDGQTNVTIPHEIQAKYKSAAVLLRPATPGTGVIAGGAVRAVCDAIGITDILSKSLGSNNSLNVIKAALAGFELLSSPSVQSAARGVAVKDMWG